MRYRRSGKPPGSFISPIFSTALFTVLPESKRPGGTTARRSLAEVPGRDDAGTEPSENEEETIDLVDHQRVRDHRTASSLSMLTTRIDALARFDASS
jgi:hypothetical protein